MIVRPATPADRSAIHTVNAAAFGQADEADLVDMLRDRGDALIERVAERQGAVVGHILFSPLRLVPAPPDAPNLAALAPVAVAPDVQRRGIGGALIRDGLRACGEAGVAAVIVLGHHDYYPRFGFSAALAEALDAPFSGPAFMALELRPGALARARGRLVYAPPFGLDPAV